MEQPHGSGKSKHLAWNNNEDLQDWYYLESWKVLFCHNLTDNLKEMSETHES